MSSESRLIICWFHSNQSLLPVIETNNTILGGHNHRYDSRLSDDAILSLDSYYSIPSKTGSYLLLYLILVWFCSKIYQSYVDTSVSSYHQHFYVSYLLYAITTIISIITRSIIQSYTILISSWCFILQISCCNIITTLQYDTTKRIIHILIYLILIILQLSIYNKSLLQSIGDIIIFEQWFFFHQSDIIFLYRIILQSYVDTSVSSYHQHFYVSYLLYAITTIISIITRSIIQSYTILISSWCFILQISCCNIITTLQYDTTKRIIHILIYLILIISWFYPFDIKKHSSYLLL